jgi:hypothetical protein
VVGIEPGKSMQVISLCLYSGHWPRFVRIEASAAAYQLQ